MNICLSKYLQFEWKMVKGFTDPWANTNALATVMLLSFLLHLSHLFFLEFVFWMYWLAKNIILIDWKSTKIYMHFQFALFIKVSFSYLWQLLTFSFVVSSNFSQQESPTAKIIGLYFLGTIVPRKYMPTISAVGLFCWK